MCDKLEHHDLCGLARRQFLKKSGAAAAIGLLGPAFFSQAVLADALTHAQRDKMTPAQIVEIMKKGNERFRRGERHDRNYLREE
ncbi:MAG: twin-arginine translocation signal domain-containing protein [Betaproteobacteria bacterium]